MGTVKETTPIRNPCSIIMQDRYHGIMDMYAAHNVCAGIFPYTSESENELNEMYSVCVLLHTFQQFLIIK